MISLPGYLRQRCKFFQNQVQTEPLLGFFSQNVIVVTYVAMPAGCGLVNDVCYSRGVLYMRYFDKQPNKGLPQVNDVLTPRACQALLTYTLTLGEPVRCSPLSVFTMLASSVSHISSTLLSILHWVRHRNFLSDRVSAGLPLHSTAPMHSLVFR